MPANNISHNIIKLNIIKVAKWFMLTAPIMMLFYKEMGFNAEESFRLKAFYSISIVIFEIPSGYLADVIGRRKTIIIGSIFGTLGFVIYSLMTGYWPFLMAEMTLGFGMSCISGADSALLYDSLKVTGRDHLYVKYEGQNFSVGNFAEAMAGITGGALAEISLRFPFFVQTGIALMAIPAALMLVEPPLHSKRMAMGMKEIWGVVRHSLIDNRPLRWNIVYSSIIGAATLTMAWVIQLYLAHIGYREYQIGMVAMALNLVVGFATLSAYKAERYLSPTTTVWVTTLIITGSFMVAGFFQSGWIIGCFVLFYIARGIATPVLKDYVNQITGSHIRATVLSIRSLIIRAVFAVVAPLFGWFTDQWSLSEAFIFLGLFYMATTGASIGLFLKTLPAKGNR
ncbi:MAG: MFS transporter [Marinilabiliaceae bacterium]|nr:MFS transporter [Marinilabiliaceae bacterium]